MQSGLFETKHNTLNDIIHEIHYVPCVQFYNNNNWLSLKQGKQISLNLLHVRLSKIEVAPMSFYNQRQEVYPQWPDYITDGV